MVLAVTGRRYHHQHRHRCQKEAASLSRTRWGYQQGRVLAWGGGGVGEGVVGMEFDLFYKEEEHYNALLILFVFFFSCKNRFFLLFMHTSVKHLRLCYTSVTFRVALCKLAEKRTVGTYEPTVFQSSEVLVVDTRFIVEMNGGRHG